MEVLGFAFSEAFVEIHCLYLFRGARCPLGDQASLPALEGVIKHNSLLVTQ